MMNITTFNIDLFKDKGEMWRERAKWAQDSIQHALHLPVMWEPLRAAWIWLACSRRSAAIPSSDDLRVASN